MLVFDLLVFKKPLARFSQSPMTGFFRDGYCRVGPEDGGNHAVAGTLRLSRQSIKSSFRYLSLSSFKRLLKVLAKMLTYAFPRTTQHTGLLTREFLDFSASRGNNLRSIGLEPGCKWCLCTARWKEAVNARKGDDDPVVPK